MHVSAEATKRKTSGFILSDNLSTAREIGDEPAQIKHKYPDILVACDGNRVRGIEKLLALPESPEVIILDDAFQHRYVQADKNIVLMVTTVRCMKIIYSRLAGYGKILQL